MLLYILPRDSAWVSTQLNIRDALSKFLLAKGRTRVVDEGKARLYDIILGQTPDWLSLPESFLNPIASKAAGPEDRGEHGQG